MLYLCGLLLGNCSSRKTTRTFLSTSVLLRLKLLRSINFVCSKIWAPASCLHNLRANPLAPDSLKHVFEHQAWCEQKVTSRTGKGTEGKLHLFPGCNWEGTLTHYGPGCGKLLWAHLNLHTDPEPVMWIDRLALHSKQVTGGYLHMVPLQNGTGKRGNKMESMILQWTCPASRLASVPHITAFSEQTQQVIRAFFWAHIRRGAGRVSI